MEGNTRVGGVAEERPTETNIEVQNEQYIGRVAYFDISLPGCDVYGGDEVDGWWLSSSVGQGQVRKQHVLSPLVVYVSQPPRPRT